MGGGGILGGYMSGGPTGLLGGGQAAPYGSFGEWAKANPDTVSALAMGLLSGPTFRDSLAGASAGYAQAAPMDRRRQAVNTWLKAGGPTDIQNPATAALFQDAPDLAEKYIAGKLSGPSQTDDMQEYSYALSQGYKGSFFDYQRDLKKSGATSVNVGPQGESLGNPPNDMAWARDANGNVLYEADPTSGYRRPVAVPIGGTKVDKTAAAASDAADTRKAVAGFVSQDIDRAIKKIEDADKSFVPATGLPGSVAQNIPGTAANDVRNLIDGVKANVTFDKLQAMREASPTGGALGQVSNFENYLMSSTLGSLDQSQTRDQLLANLKRVKLVYEKIINEGIKPGDPIAAEIMSGASPTSASPAAPAAPSRAAPVYTSPSGAKVYPE